MNRYDFLDDPSLNPSLERVTLVGGQVIYAHRSGTCAGPNGVCCIHNPTNHHMKDWPQNWREDRGIMERICEHGCGHPDPDDLAILAGRDSGIHGCEGCCFDSSRGVDPEELP